MTSNVYRQFILTLDLSTVRCNEPSAWISFVSCSVLYCTVLYGTVQAYYTGTYGTGTYYTVHKN
jgi:hypothetical protein